MGGLDLDRLKKELLEDFKKMKYVKNAFIFGSAADGKFTESSDIDVLLVIADDASMAERLQLNAYIKKFSTERWLLDIWYLPEKQFEALQRGESVYTFHFTLTEKEYLREYVKLDQGILKRLWPAFHSL